MDVDRRAQCKGTEEGWDVAEEGKDRGAMDGEMDEEGEEEGDRDGTEMRGMQAGRCERRKTRKDEMVERKEQTDVVEQKENESRKRKITLSRERKLHKK